MIQPRTIIRVGNDVVDLEHPRCRDRPRGDRLPIRILSHREMEWFAAPQDPEHRLRRLWSLWAAKETAFKVVSKLEGSPPVFRHRELAVHLSDEGSPEGGVQLVGSVEWRGHRCQLQGMATCRFLHMVGWGGVAGPLTTDPPQVEVGVEGWGNDGEVPPPTADEEAAGVQHLQSARARRLAQARLASYLAKGAAGGAGQPGADTPPRVRIETSRDRPGRTPPRVLVDEKPRPEIDLSISHHGRYVAWALLIPSASSSDADKTPR